jgi:GNAT superfamily N-acetyltransferase
MIATIIVRHNVPSKRHGRYTRVVELQFDGEFIGRACLKKIRPGIGETHSHILRPYRRRGYGTLLYLKLFDVAKQNGFQRVVSSPIRWMTVGSQRLWKSFARLGLATEQRGKFEFSRMDTLRLHHITNDNIILPRNLESCSMIPKIPSSQVILHEHDPGLEPRVI